MNRPAAWVLLVVPLVLTGCTSDDGKKPAALPSLAPPAASPSGAPVPTVPAEATAETAQGATAFARYYFEVVNQAYATSDAGAVTALSDPGCNSCKNAVVDVDRLAAAGRKVAGKRFSITSAEASQLEPDGSVLVDFRFDSDRYLEVDASGGVVQDFAPRSKQDAQVKLSRTQNRWRVAGVRMIEP